MKRRVRRRNPQKSESALVVALIATVFCSGWPAPSWRSGLDTEGAVRVGRAHEGALRRRGGPLAGPSRSRRRDRAGPRRRAESGRVLERPATGARASTTATTRRRSPCTARANDPTRGVEAVIRAPRERLYANALFAGNSSGDPNYDLKFGGTGAQADHVNGNVYSGGNISIAGTATHRRHRARSGHDHRRIRRDRHHAADPGPRRR